MIIDIRNKKEFNEGHVAGAINVSYGKILLYPEKYLNKETEADIICARGVKSAAVVKTLTKRGYKVSDVVGGYQAIK